MDWLTFDDENYEVKLCWGGITCTDESFIIWPMCEKFRSNLIQCFCSSNITLWNLYEQIMYEYHYTVLYLIVSCNSSSLTCKSRVKDRFNIASSSNAWKLIQYRPFPSSILFVYCAFWRKSSLRIQVCFSLNNLWLRAPPCGLNLLLQVQKTEWLNWGLEEIMLFVIIDLVSNAFTCTNPSVIFHLNMFGVLCCLFDIRSFSNADKLFLSVPLIPPKRVSRTGVVLTCIFKTLVIWFDNSLDACKFNGKARLVMKITSQQTELSGMLDFVK